MKPWRRQVAIVLICQVLVAGNAFAATLGDPSFSSSSYQVIESEIGGNGQFDSTSANYAINPTADDGGSSLGESAVGNSASSGYQTNSGFNTTAQPGLTLIVNTSSINFGTVPVGTKTQASATFSVKNYTSYGYAVKIVGAAPQMGSKVLTALGTDTPYNATQEQFGINLRANTAPVFGADPVQSPSAAFSFGVAGDGTTGIYGTTRPYTIPDQYRFVSGETVASAPKSSGETDYTVACMMNAITTTPAEDTRESIGCC
jgi:hypothetical protein